MAITAAEARARLERMVAASAVPTLEPAEVDDLMLLAARNDSADLPPGDADWAPTYALNAAAAEGWRWKAGKVAGAVNLSQDGSSINRSDMHKACMEQAEHYAAIGNVSVGDVSTATRYRSWTIGLDAPAGPGVGYGPPVAADINGIVGRVIDYGPPTLVQASEEA